MNDIIWAMGGRRSRDIAHVYLTKEDYEKGICLCGRQVMPHLAFDGWDLANEEMKNHSCPSCMERLNLLKFTWKGKNQE